MSTNLDLELHAYVDGDLDDADMARVEDYLRKNPEALLKIQAYLRQKDDIRHFAQQELVTDEAPEAYRLGRKLAEQLKPKPRHRGKRTLAFASLFVAGWLGHSVYLPLVEGPAYANSVVQAHLFSSSDPAEVPPMSPERLSKLYSHIGEAEMLPDLRPLGFEPVGAQLLPSDEGMVLHVPYRKADGTTISYFLLHRPVIEEQAPRAVRQQGVTLMYWQHDYSRHALAAPLPEAQVQQIIHHLEASNPEFRAATQATDSDTDGKFRPPWIIFHS